MLIRALFYALLSAITADSARADLAVITSQGGEALTFYDTDKREIVHQLALEGQPAAIAVSKDYVASVAVGTKTLHLYDHSGKLLGKHVFDGAPFAVAFAPDNHVYVTDAAGQGWVHRLSLPELGLEQSLKAAANPTGVDVDDLGHVVVAARDADLALIYRADCAACWPQSIGVGHHPFGVTLYGGRAFVTNVLSNDVSVIDLNAQREIARITTGVRPYAVTFAAGLGFVSNQYDATLTVFDANTLAEIATLETADYPEGLSATSDGKVLVAAWLSDLVQIFDAQSLMLEAEIEMPQGPRAFGRFITPLGGP